MFLDSAIVGWTSDFLLEQDSVSYLISSDAWNFLDPKAMRDSSG